MPNSISTPTPLKQTNATVCFEDRYVIGNDDDNDGDVDDADGGGDDDDDDDDVEEGGGGDISHRCHQLSAGIPLLRIG